MIPTLTRTLTSMQSSCSVIRSHLHREPHNFTDPEWEFGTVKGGVSPVVAAEVSPSRKFSSH